MKKNRHLGFMLIETLLVSTFVLGVLTYLFVQFSALKRSYDDNFKYDTVPGLYGVRNINEYIKLQNGYSTLKNSVNDTYGYLEFSCAMISGTTCSKLVENLDIKTIYFVKDNIFKNNVKIDLSIFVNDDELYHFCKKINFSDEDRGYHLIVKYNNNTYATMSITL